MSRVPATQRFSAAHPCPVCGGHDRLPRGEGIRCAGFRSDDGRWGHCTREEYAGGLPLKATSLTYAHRLDGVCRCGGEHDSASLARSVRSGPNGHSPSPASRRAVATYSYRDETGALLFEVIRYEPKDFSQRRPDGHGGWIYETKGVRRVLYRLPELTGLEGVYLVEGEKDVDSLWAQGLPATTSPGGAGQWSDDYASQLRAAGVEIVVIIPDNDRPGVAHAAVVQRSCEAAGLSTYILTLPGLPPVRDIRGEDVSGWLQAGHSVAEIEALVEATLTAPGPDGAPPPAVALRALTPWGRAVSATDFLAQAEQDVAWREAHVLAPGSLTEIFAPRGLGKSHVLHGILVKLARRGTRCLLLDRDNSRREVKRRLRAWGAAALPSLHVMLRDDVPPLTDSRAWAQFPFAEYDVVAIDSLDASAEGVGEQDSAKPSRALAPILDLCHRAAGPAIVILGNVIKSGAHSRGSGVVEDRADIAFEVRDCTDLTPSGTKDWWQELPPAGAETWAARASRRKRRDTYRLAFVPSKFRIGEEPEPFAYELNLGSTPWSLRLCTEEILAAGREAQETAKQERQAQLERAAAGLRAAMAARVQAGAAPMTSADTEGYLKQEHYRRRADARALLAAHEGVLWGAQVDAGRAGRPKLWHPLNGPQASFAEGSAAETPRRKSPALTPSDEGGISADRMDRTRQKHTPAETRMNSGDSEEGVSAAEPNSKEAPGAGEDRL